MRPGYAIVIIALAVLAIAAKLFYFRSHKAGAISSQAGLDILQMP
jgi:hypothetical protein